MNKKIAIITYARFPSEMAYGNHLIQIANSFIDNGFNVSIYYPKTYNTKTIDERPEKYYGVKRGIVFKEINNFDITSYSIYNLLPSFIKKIIYSLNTFIWSVKLKKYFDEISAKYPTLFDDYDDFIATLQDGVEQLEDTVKTASELFGEELLQAVVSSTNAFTTQFVDALLQGESALEAFHNFSRQLVSQIIATFLQLAVVNEILNESNKKLTPSKFNQDFFKNLEKKIKFVKCNLLTVQKIVGGKGAKLKLVKKFKSISVIDMEAYYIKEELLKVNIPMLSFKVIFDDLTFDIPSYILDCINDKGELKISHFLKSLILKPERIFELISVNFKFSKSKKVLESLVNSF